MAFMKNATPQPLVFNINFKRKSKILSGTGAKPDSEIRLQRGNRAESDLMYFALGQIKGGIQKAGSSVDQTRITAQAAFFISER